MKDGFMYRGQANDRYKDFCLNGTVKHDNAPKYTAKVVQNWIHNTGKIQVLSWPSPSLDLNTIENLWAISDKNLKSRHYTNNYNIFQCL